MKILIVDDNRDVRLLLERVVIYHGRETLEAVDGWEGFEKAAIHNPPL